jgi:hypothetical protein
MWKLRLQRYLDGTSDENLDPEHICQDNQCVLGKWIYGNQERYAKSAIFEEVRGKHAEFHKTAAQIVRLINEDHKQQAGALLGGEYSHLSHNLQAMIRRLARDLDYEA